MTMTGKACTAVLAYASVPLLAQILAKLSSFVRILLAMASSSASEPAVSSSSAGKLAIALGGSGHGCLCA